MPKTKVLARDWKLEIGVSGVNQVETATVVGTITVAGNATVTVTAAGLAGSPKAISVPVTVGDNATVIATKMRNALALDSAINSMFTIGGSGVELVLTKIIPGADDSTLNIAIATGTATGVTAAATSANTVAGSATPQWYQVKGLSSLTFSNSKNDADTTDFDSQGNTEHMVASRAREISGEGMYLLDLATRARDAGQEAVETLAEQVGVNSLGSFRLTNPAGTVKSFSASANVGDVGGGNDDPTSWGLTLTVSGQVMKG